MDISLNDKQTVTVIIYSSCLIIIMHWDIWECLGMPLLPNYIMHMEAVNRVSNLMKAMLPRVMLHVSDI
jgi:hypothetical protein